MHLQVRCCLSATSLGMTCLCHVRRRCQECWRIVREIVAESLCQDAATSAALTASGVCDASVCRALGRTLDLMMSLTPPPLLAYVPLPALPVVRYA